MTTLQEIRSTIAEPLARMEALYRERLASPVPLVNEINNYLLARSGKQIRPLLVLLASFAGNNRLTEEDVNEKIQLAIAVEMLHNSSLMHDDVVDESPLRRGRETVRQRWSNKIAVLCGDYYLAMVMDILNDIGNKEVRHIVNNTVIEMSEGELLQQQISHNMDRNEEQYYQVIYMKTASLMSACCEIGHPALKDYGTHFGMAFQIRDDIMDYHPDAETGKPQGNDIREKKMTLPLLCYLRESDEEEVNRVTELLKQEVIDDHEADDLVRRVVESNALDKAKEILNQRIGMAIEAIRPIAESEYKESLKKLAQMLK